MDIKGKIELIRNTLDSNLKNEKTDFELILKISKLTDEYINEYYKELKEKYN